MFCLDSLDVANTLLFWLGNMNYNERSIKPRKKYYYIINIKKVFQNLKHLLMVFPYFLFSTIKKST